MTDPIRQPNVVIAHTAAPPFVRQAAKAFDEVSRLRLACIGFSTRKDDPLLRACRVLPGTRRLARLLERRLFEDVPRNRQRRFPIYEYLRLASGRVDRTGILTDKLWDFGTRQFDRWSARQLAASDIAYGYEYGCLAFLKRARELGLPTIYEIPSAEHDYYDRIMQRELNRFPDLRTAWHVATARKQAERSKRRHEELALADRVIVYSSHVVESYRASGFPTDNFRVVPLGAPPVRDQVSPKSLSGPLRLIWAGTFGIRKGAHYLVEALEQFPQGAVDLDIFGTYALSESWRERVSRVASLHGPIAYNDLLEHMARADLLVLPSLSEAFGMVVTEAMACGTPVLVTESVGAADLVRHGVNGLVVESGSAAALVEGIGTALESRRQLGGWGQSARDTAADWQWPQFRAALREASFGIE